MNTKKSGPLLVLSALLAVFPTQPYFFCQSNISSAQESTALSESSLDLARIESQLPSIGFSSGSTANKKKSCSKVYPLPRRSSRWTNCVRAAASACGGAEECACDSTERLVEYSCTEGTYKKCTTEPTCANTD